MRPTVWLACLFTGGLLLSDLAAPVAGHALAQSDVSAVVSVKRSGFVLNRATNTFDSVATLTNTSQRAVGAPISLVIASIAPSGVTLANASGFTAGGEPFVDVPVTALSPGQSEGNILLKFDNPSRVSFTFTTRVLAVVQSQLGLRFESTCAVLPTGTVKCWGSVFVLVGGTATLSTTPVTMDGITTATAVAAGFDHQCAVLSSGTVQCWGANLAGNLGDGTTTSSLAPVTVSGISTATHIAVGDRFSCARLSSGTVQCWGENHFGQLGAGLTCDSTSGVGCISSTPVAVTGITAAVAVAAGRQHACALLSNGTVQCWGVNTVGQIGDGTFPGGDSTTPVTVTGITTATAVTAGGNHTCARLSDGTARCWGDNFSGQLGTATGPCPGFSPACSPTPVMVTGITTATAVTAGGGHTCARLSDGRVECWGRNFEGELGNGTTTDSATPVAVTGVTTATDVAASATGFHSCAVLAGGPVKCWGSNRDGQLGDGTAGGVVTASPSLFPGITTPVAVMGITTATVVAAGVGHNCARLSDGTVQCWGSNGDGQLGNGTTGASFTPVTVTGITTATEVAAGGFNAHSCARLSNGTVQCWGSNVFGKLGNGTTTDSATPVAATGITTAVGVSAGNAHICAVLSNGTVQCWGGNISGQLGDGTTTGSPTPVTVTRITTATAVAAGTDHTCALLADGTVQCWGSNASGQLGSAIPDSSIPVAVPGITAATAIAAGTRYTCAVLSNGTVPCWGGTLGAATGITTATAVAAGTFLTFGGGLHTCALLSNGAVQCWGQNASGQLGNGTKCTPSFPPELTCVGSTTPVTVTGITTATGVAVGERHTCAVLSNGTVQCWGDNSSGQAGNGLSSISVTPVDVVGL